MIGDGVSGASVQGTVRGTAFYTDDPYMPNVIVIADSEKRRLLNTRRATRIRCWG